MLLPRRSAAALIAALLVPGLGLVGLLPGCKSGGGGGGGFPTGGGAGGTTGGTTGGGGGQTGGTGGVFLPGGSPATTPEPTPALAGKRAVISPGHGYIYYSTLGRWSTQRGSHHGLLEDIHTNEICIDHLFGDLEGAGLRVFSCRERDKASWEAIVQNEAAAPAYSEVGSWTTSAQAGQGYAATSYRYAQAAPSETAVAWFRPSFPAAARHAVYVWYSAGPNRSGDARFVVEHAGGRSVVSVDQRANGGRWWYLGTWHFQAGRSGGVGLSNESSQAGVVIADAVKFGGGMGTFVEGGTTSGQPRWREGARAHLPFVGVPASLNTGDVTVRPRYADWQGADVYVSLHTNAADSSGTSTAVGTSTYIHNTNPSAGSGALQASIHDQLIRDIRALWVPAWRDRGKLSANFGEVREVRTMPAVLIELAFHDNPTHDARFLRDEQFRRDAARAIYKGIARYLAPNRKVTPIAPTHLTVLNAGGSALRVGWRAGRDAIEGANAAATGFVVYRSENGLGFDDGTYTTDGSLLVPNLAPGRTYYFKVAGVNEAGRGKPTEVLAARVAPDGRRPPTLVVSGYDRLDEFVTTRRGEQTFDAVVAHAYGLERAGRGAFIFDSASNEAVIDGDVRLPDYRAVDWVLGLESSADETFSAAEQALVSAHVAAGGSLLASGAEVAWDLGHLGSAGDRSFLGSTFGAGYAVDDAGTDVVEAAGGSIFAGLPALEFGAARGGAYPVGFPDGLSAQGGGTVALRYRGSSHAAAIERRAGSSVVVLAGFPVETIGSVDLRAQVLGRFLDAALPGHP